MMELKDKILKLRKTKGFSQQELADQLGVSRQSISKWELGESSPDINNIITLSEVFNVSTDYLLKEDIVENEIDRDKLQRIMIISLLIVLFGNICGHILWNNYQDSLSLLIGMFIQLLGIGLFEYFAVTMHDNHIQKKFWCLNIWLITFLPIRYFVNYTVTYQILYSFIDGRIGYTVVMYFPLLIALGLSAIIFGLIKKSF